MNSLRKAVGFRAIEHAILLSGDGGLVGIAEPCGRFDERLQHRLQIEGRAADDLEHVGGGGLLLQRFAQDLGARLHLVEQAHVLDRDHGLIGKGLDQIDLLIRERLELSCDDRSSMTPSRSSSLSIGTPRTVRIASAILRVHTYIRGRPGHRECGAFGVRVPRGLIRCAGRA